MTSIEKLLTSLGEPVDGNEYEIKNHNGEWWIEHKAIGSGEPLSQWLNKYIPQQEISDEEIEKFASDFYGNNGSESIFIIGAKWYREQLNKQYKK